jgi:uncharacterized membrane protein
VIRIGKPLAIAATIAYPFLMLACLVVFKASARGIGLCLCVVASLNFFAMSDSVGGAAAKARRWGAFGLSLALVALVFATDNAVFARMYPVVVNLALLAVFGFSLLNPPTAAFRIATLQDKSLRDPGPERDKAESYCRKVTVVWCCFFALNGSIALYTALVASPVAWSVYNGFISYLLMGALFLGETLARRRAMRS